MESRDRLLREILRTNAGSAFGRRHGFDGITSFPQYQERVPVAQYEDLEPYISRAMNGEPNSSPSIRRCCSPPRAGRPGRPKYIPMTREGKEAKSRLTWLWLCGLYRDHPGIVGGRILSVVSPEIEGHAPSGVPIGAESGHAYRTVPPPVRSMYTSPYQVFTIDDYEAKYYTLLRLAAGQNISLIATVNPSTIVLLADRLGRHTESIIRDVRDGSCRASSPCPRRSAARCSCGRTRPAPPTLNGRPRPAGNPAAGLAWPNLAAIGCWKGGTVGAYLANFDTYFPQRPPIRDLGYYATELRGSVPMTDEGDSGVLAVGTNLLEFHRADDDSPPDPRSLLSVEDLEVGRRYFVYVTNNSGLYRYDMNDIVEVTGLHNRTPLVRFIQKGKGVVSFTGEKLYEVQVIAAVEEALAADRGRYNFIAAVAELVDGRAPRLVFLIEFDEDSPNRP